MDEGEIAASFSTLFSEGILEAINGEVRHDDNVTVLSLLGIRIP